MLFRDPSASLTQVTFGYAGNIWIANRDGSNPRRLTDGGHEEKPRFSPDGSQIAFTGRYDGTRAVYVMSAAGSEPRRLTYHPADLGVVGWTPDGKRILFSSRRTAFARAVVQLFTVPAEGGFAIPVPLTRASEASLSPDAARIAYVPGIPSQQAWKRYRGGQTRPIWIANLTDSKIEASIPRDNSNDFNPMWVGDRIYFLSDRSGPVSLFSYDLKSQQVKQVIENNGLDFKSASASSDAIVYEKFGSLHLLDLKSEKDLTLNIRIAGEFPEVRPHFLKVDPRRIRSAALSPTGARAAFGVRGEVLTVPADKGDIRNLTQTTDAVERDPAWSPNGRYIAYLSDESGEYSLYVRDQNGLGKARKINLGNQPTFYYSPSWSPDSKKIGYTDKRLNYWYVDLDRKVPVRIDTDMYVDPPPPDSPNPAHGLREAWSPDSRWIAYTKQLQNHLHAAFIYSLEQGKSYQLTDGMSDVFYVVFDKGGKYLYFAASTDLGLSGSSFDMSGLDRPVTRSVYIMMLKKALPSPLAPESDEEGVEPKEKKIGNGRATEDAAKVEIDLEGISQRILALPIPARNWYGLLAGRPGMLFLLEGPQVDPLLPYSIEYGGEAAKVHKFDLKTRTTEQILEDVTSFDLSFSGEKMLYARQERWFIAQASQVSPNAGERGRLNLDDMEIYVDPRREWRHMYQQVWRGERDFFYDPGLHGLDLRAIESKYEPYLDSICTRDDLNYLFAEMLGNLTVSHVLVYGGDIPEVARAKTGLLGADYSIENGRYRLARIYSGDNWNPKLHAPLAQPSVDVQVGEYLLAINGRDIRPPRDLYSFFAETAGKQVILKVGPNYDGSGSREVTVIPVDDEAPLRNHAWIENNRRTVDQLTGGRVAYVYLPDTNAGGYTSFNRYYFAQLGKDAAIIDERYNGGGFVADYIVDYLRRPLIGYFHMRDGKDFPSPVEAIFGPKVMIINEMAGSGGDALPWMFRKAGIGPLIGKRTWGGLNGWYTLPADLLDGGVFTTPNIAFYDNSNNWAVENHGVPPDFEVEDGPMAERSGHDPQLEKAVDVVLELVRKKPPPPAPHRPPYPNYQNAQTAAGS